MPAVVAISGLALTGLLTFVCAVYTLRYTFTVAIHDLPPMLFLSWGFLSGSFAGNVLVCLKEILRWLK